jgi:hypothetical protein
LAWYGFLPNKYLFGIVFHFFSHAWFDASTCQLFQLRNLMTSDFRLHPIPSCNKWESFYLDMLIKFFWSKYIFIKMTTVTSCHIPDIPWLRYRTGIMATVVVPIGQEDAPHQVPEEDVNWNSAAVL